MGPVTINILGHLQVFQQGLVALQMIFHPNTGATDWSNGANWMGIGPVALLALTFAILHISTKGIWMQKVELHHVGMMLGMYAVLFVPTVSVDIHDMTTGQDAIVDNIPIGIAYPAAGISALAVDAANQIGTAFQSPTAINPPLDLNSGVASPLKQMLGLRHFYYQVATQNPGLTLGLASFVQSCVYPLSNAGGASQATFGAINQDPNLLGGGNGTLFTMPIPATNGGIVTMETLGTRSGNPCGASPAGAQCTESCAQAREDLKTAYTAWYNGTGTPNCSTAVTSTTTKQDVPQITDCSASANTSLAPVVGSASSGSTSGNAGTNLANTGTFGSDFIQQIYGACVVSAGWQMGLNGTAGQNNPIVMPSYCQIQGTSQNSYNVENAASANMFISNMLPMMSILQFLFFALAPLAAAVMLFAGAQGVGIFTKYLMFGLWTQSWFPVAAVLNAYGQMTVSEELAKYGLAMTGGGSITPSATTFATMAQIPEVLLRVQNILGNVDMMLALTPVITMIVFTGSYMAMSQMAQDINGEVQTGKNVGLEAPSIDRQMVANNVQASGVDGGYDTVNPLGKTVALNVGSSVSSGVAAAHQQEASATKSLSDSVSQTASSVVSLLRSHKDIEAAERAAQASGNTKLAHSLDALNKSGQTFTAGDEQGLKTDLAAVLGLSAGLSAGAKLGGGDSPFSAGGKIGIDGGLQGKTGGSVAQTAKQAALHELAETLASKNGAEFTRQLADSHKEGNSSETAGSLQSSLQQMHQRSAALQTAVKNADSWNQTAQEAQNWGGGATLHSDNVQSALIRQGVGGSRAQPYLQQMAEQAGAGKQFDALYNRYMSMGSFSSADAASVAILSVARGNADVARQVFDMTLGQGAAVSTPQNAATERFNTAQKDIGSTSSAVDAGKRALDPVQQAADAAGDKADTQGRTMATQGVGQYGATPSLRGTPQGLANQGSAELGSQYTKDTAGTQAWIDGKTGHINDNIAVQGAKLGQDLEQGASDGIHHAVKAVKQNLAEAQATGAAHVAAEKTEAAQAEKNAAAFNQAVSQGFDRAANFNRNPDSAYGPSTGGMVRLSNGSVVPAGEAPPQDVPVGGAAKDGGDGSNG